ncbi:MAG: hypothetical protein RSA66_09355 [Muribaculaceae bacterium]
MKNPKSFNALHFIALQDYIKVSIPTIQWIDQDMRQDTAEPRPTLAFPALLIDYADTQFSEASASALVAEATIRMRLIDAPTSQSYADAPLHVRTDALEFYELEHAIIEALHGWTPNEDMAQPLILKSANTERSDPALRIRTLTFTTAYSLDTN